MPTRRSVCAVLLLALLLLPARPAAEKLEKQYWPLLSQEQVRSIMESVSGETARDHVTYITQYWRWAPSRGFHDVGEYIVAKAKSYGLKDAHIESFIADKTTTYLGAPIYRPKWDPVAGELWVVEPVRKKITSFADVPMSIAGYSRNTDVVAELIDVGSGTSANDYANKDVRGKIVLATGAVGVLQRLAVFERGALGVATAWVPEMQTSRSPLDNADQVTWGSGVVAENDAGQRSTFGFMLSPRQHQVLAELLKTGKPVKVHAKVKADLEEPGYMEVVTATIPGRELPNEELVFSAHLEHPKPAANDNTSGSAAILEVARVLQQLVASGQLPPPKRTIRFLWVQEGRSTRAYLEKHLEAREKVFAVINMDIVGNDQQKTKAILYLWTASASHPSFASDVVQDFFEFVRNTNNDRQPTEPLDSIVAPTGNRRPFIGSVERFKRPSDQSNFIALGIPGINFAAWPDEFHHTPFDTPEKVDPTQMERVAFIGAASAAVLANAGPETVPEIVATVAGRARTRLGEDLTKALRLLQRATPDQLAESYREAQTVVRWGYIREQRTLDSLRLLASKDANMSAYLQEQKAIMSSAQDVDQKQLTAKYTQRARLLGRPAAPLQPTAAERRAEERIPVWRSPNILDGEGILHHLDKAVVNRLRILRYTDDARTLNFHFMHVFFETLNFIDGTRSVKEIRDAVSAEYDPVPLDVVEELVAALESATIVEVKTKRR